MILGLGLRADYQKKYTIDLGYTAFLDKASTTRSRIATT